MQNQQHLAYHKFLKEIDNQKILLGTLLSKLNEEKTEKILRNIQESEFRVFSQWGDDGIVDFLVRYLDLENKTFIEFGVENYREANTRFLLVNRNWKGLIFDSTASNIESVKKEDIYWQFDLIAKTAFITRENINQLIKENGIIGETGLLHIDIDGNDYWIWEAIQVVDPVIVIMEYNSVLGYEESWTIPYSEKFNRMGSHFSSLYFGSSLQALCDLAETRGYSFIGCNSNGNNAYFVKKEKQKDLIGLTAKEGYVMSKFRESRDKNGNLTYIGGEDRLNQIKGLKVYNTRKKQIETIK